eukprot:CAMPEP_0119282804 /NCGR_PEP_ID=MMETSP1329-20130426/27332_1 /TAXON_ID=114041 /ORGANISM="Genus nov. species nov., Strain RCC1024" /LENGTH=51 /DNA_ID=CAMNT_0007283465 /DNA_START=142 /DNA_END=293 /DNA_ORIENTATION=-
MRVRCFTWNVCGLDIEALGVDDAAALDKCLENLACGGAVPDVVCCGVVEIV